MTRTWFVLATFVLVTAVGTASAQGVTYPGRPYSADSMADRLRDRIELQRQSSAGQAAFARQYSIEARLRQLEIEAGRLPGPHIRREAALQSPELERQARERATARREAVTQGVGQIDDWLAGTPR